MADGSLKAIKDVRPGDWVVSRDPATGMTEARQVLSTSARQTPGVLRLWLADPATGAVVQALEATPNHPLYVQGRGFVTAGQVGLGESLVSRAGPGLVVSAVERLPGDREYDVFNLVVDGDHTYFVGTENGGVWVHNGRPCGKFSIIDWSGYPSGLPKPEGPFELLEKGPEYDQLREEANQANRLLKRQQPDLKGWDLHELHPVKWGGSPTDPENKWPLSGSDHDLYSVWWMRLQRRLENLLDP